MKLIFKHLKVLLIISSVIVGKIAICQLTDETLPRTIIFKAKEQYRSKCSRNSIYIPQFNQLAVQIGVDKLEKIFPEKEKEKTEGNIDLSLIYKLHYSSPFPINVIITQLKKLKIAEYVEPYYLPKLCYTPNDTLLANQYYINLIKADSAWGINKGDTDVIIGITDTGWDPVHPDLLGNVKLNYADPINGSDDDGDGYIDNYMGWDLGMDDNDAMVESTIHGINVTGIAAAVTDNVTGIAGVGFNCKFLPVKIANSAGILTQAYQGIVYAADHGCFVINCSWGGFVSSQFGQNIVDYATINKGCLVVAAVGNNGSDTAFYPAAYNGVLSVAATEQSDLKASFSNYGYYVDISTPGQTIWTTSANGGYATNGGTSMSAPIVSGGAALLKSQFPSYNNQQIAALIQATADDLNALNPSYVDQLGSGRLNLFKGVLGSSAQFVELVSEDITDHNNTIYEFGDSLFITGTFTNYFNNISGLTVTLTSASPYVNIIDGTTTLPTFNGYMSYANSVDPFIVEVLNGAAFNEEVLFKAEITNGTYTNNEYFTVILNPDYINLVENQVSTTITSNGKIGFNDINNTVGLGFTYNDEQLIYESGLMIGDGNTRVADAVRGVTAQDMDFSSQQNVQFHPPYVSAMDLYGVTDDSPMSSPMDIKIEQYSYAYPNAPDDKYVIVAYTIENTGLTALSNLYAGLFTDWDIIDYATNKAGFDASRKMGYVHSMNNDTIYGAVKVLSVDTGVNYSIDLDGSGGVNPNSGGFDASEKYITLSTYRNTAGGVTGADVAHVVSSGSFSLNSGQKVSVAFAIIAGDSLSDIQASADAAQIRYVTDAIGISETEQNDDFKIYPNPSHGILNIYSKEKIKIITLKNIFGENLQKFRFGQLDISRYPNGIYLLDVVTEKSKRVQKIVLSK